LSVAWLKGNVFVSVLVTYKLHTEKPSVYIQLP